jgi:hypothetical protein
MSALFDSGTGTLASPWTIAPILELRQVPLVRTLYRAFSEDDWTGTSWFGNIAKADATHSEITRDFYDLKANWMYTAIIQTALDGPAPTWSKDDWSFVPILLSPEDLLSVQDSLPQFEGAPAPANLTVETPAIRVSLDCSMWESANNASAWLFRKNSTMNSTSLKSYYQLPSTVFEVLSNRSTRVTAQGVAPQCCGNVTDDNVQVQTYDPAVVAYWTEDWLEDESSILSKGKNFTIKWIRGPAGFVGKPDYEFLRYLVFSEVPVVQALSCMPKIESSTAEVLVDLTSGIVQDYRIVSMPVPEDVAWSDYWTYRNLSEKPQFQNISADHRDYTPFNVTTRSVLGHLNHSTSDDIIAMASTSWNHSCRQHAWPWQDRPR